MSKGLFFFKITRKSESDIGSDSSAMASLNAVVSARGGPAALAPSGIICLRAERQWTGFSAPSVIAVDIRNKGMSGGANSAAVPSDILIPAGADRAAGSARVGG